MVRKNQREVGSRYEEKAAAFLQKQGLMIVERNYRCRTGEIDIVARDQGTYVFCEVKYRQDNGAGDPAEAVDWRKQHTIFQTASWYLYQNRLPEDTPCRFDMVAIIGNEKDCEIRWVQNAFGGW